MLILFRIVIDEGLNLYQVAYPQFVRSVPRLDPNMVRDFFTSMTHIFQQDHARRLPSPIPHLAERRDARRETPASPAHLS